MSTNAKEARFRKQLKAIETHKAEMAKPVDQRNVHIMMLPRDRIRVRTRCKLCGRGRAVYQKFGICRICLRNMASDGLIPGMRKASW